MKNLWIALFLLMSATAMGQTLTQAISGQVVDADTKVTLPGVNVQLLDSGDVPVGVVSDINGRYRLEDVKVGRVNLKFSFIGYKPYYASGVSLTSGKELVINVELEQSAVMMDEVVISASQDKEAALNEMALVSSKVFTVEETEKYAGSRGDPARMASNFAGVGGADDSRNDIVIRGNSPMGLSYRVEGVNIPNPNHFSVAGSAGGPVNIINNKVLSNSDFFTGAFPAEYGNSLSGVFDLKMRNGNTSRHELTGQFGFLGTELTAEGPLGKNHASYIVNYRYSTLAMFKFMGIQIGTNATPKYQDGSFKLSFPTKNGAIWSVFGMGGMSGIDIMISDQTEPTDELYGEQDKDQYFRTKMGFLGASYAKSFGTKDFLKLTVAQSGEAQESHHDLVYRHLENNTFKNDSFIPVLEYNFLQTKTSFNATLNHKFNAKNVVKFGAYTDYYNMSFADSAFNRHAYSWVERWNYTGQTLLVQPFAQYKFRPNDDLTITGGVHAQYLSFNKSSSWFEPRAGFKWKVGKKSSFTGGYGRHSQMQAMYTYFHHKYDDAGNRVIHNYDMDFSMSDHYIIGYDTKIGGAYFKTEAYYQQLSNIPVEVNSSSFSLVNQGTGFSRFFPDSLQNTGTGTNYGVELTYVQNFKRGFFVMSTMSLYESKYVGSDGVERDTDFNGNYIFNLLLSKEIKVREKNVLGLGTKLTVAGNKRYSPVDYDASEIAGELVYADLGRNSLQFKDYFRLDVKINYRLNRPKVTHEFALDIVNVTSQKNVLKLTYVPDQTGLTQGDIREEYQLAMLPLFYYKLEF